MENEHFVQPEKFCAAFKEAAVIHDKDLKQHWTSGLTQYTRTIRRVLDDVATLLRVNLYNSDYYTLDAVFYREKDSEHFDKDETYVKNIVVAFEHENAIRGSVSEMNKLQLFNAPLKVLVTYGDSAQRKEFLGKYTKIVKGADLFSDISTHRRQLVIFGDKPAENIEWYSFVYEEGRWVPIEKTAPKGEGNPANAIKPEHN
ncbi:MAG: hypothetical protein GJT30_00705 [Geobacter sp.]|nr:hypothetical protein [Geobacter sp.]